MAAVMVPSPGPDGVIHVRDASVSCDMELDDPRVSGRKTGPFNFDAIGELADGAFIQWGVPRTIKNDGGEWIGAFSGAYSSPTGDMITLWFEGTGAYEGLTFFEWIAGKGSLYDVTGLVYPGAPPDLDDPISGAAASVPVPSFAPATPPSAPAPMAWGDAVLVRGWERCVPVNDVQSSPDAQGVSRTRDASLECTAEFNDPRVSGTKRGPYAADSWGSTSGGATVTWSPDLRIENPDGGWVGTMRGVQTTETGGMASAWFEGRGAYKGLTLFEWIEVPLGATSDGYWVTGLIFPGKPPVVTP